MAQQRRGLGRGLGALIPTAGPSGATLTPGRDQADPSPAAGEHRRSPMRPELARVAGARFAEIPVDRDRRRTRGSRGSTFDEEALDELADSIREVGLLQPIVVRAAGAGQYELVMGERRWRAAQRGRADDIPRHRPADP